MKVEWIIIFLIIIKILAVIKYEDKNLEDIHIIDDFESENDYDYKFNPFKNLPLPRKKNFYYYKVNKKNKYLKKIKYKKTKIFHNYKLNNFEPIINKNKYNEIKNLFKINQDDFMKY